ncbi:MAG: STAS-like domain-containing protein [Rhodospirillales bacterium]|nr:STAS-like domain-containing protein [Rhodospirillales bacterium]MBN8904041.1 STAS-like domain-containing protein [Rhodospirillales bacterium]
MIELLIQDVVGDFGEDKDAAARIRETIIKPSLTKCEHVMLDFKGVNLVTQSFIHALISDALRSGGENTLDLIDFRNCSAVVRGIISTVVQYSLDTVDP